MNINNNREGVAIIISIILHILIITIPLQKNKETISHEKKELKIPINFVIEKITEKPKMSHHTKKKKIKKNQAKTKTLPQKKGMLPGDRKLPIINQSIPIPYPKTAINNEWEGKVTIAVKITANGEIDKIEIINSSGHQALDIMLVNSVRKSFTFKPKRIMGKNMPGLIKISHTFKL